MLFPGSAGLLSSERAAHDLTAEGDTELQLAMDALSIFGPSFGPTPCANVDRLLHFTVRTFNGHHNETRFIRYAFEPSPLRDGGIAPAHRVGFQRGDSAWESVQCQRRIWEQTHVPTGGYVAALWACRA